MSERRSFVDEYLHGVSSMTALCACYGISRRVGYKWIARFLVEGDRELRDQSRRPQTSPGVVAPELAALLLEVCKYTQVRICAAFGDRTAVAS